jgi:hypothetical protein
MTGDQHHGLDSYERIVATAEDEAREAAALAQALEERVKDGDEDISPAELENARQLGGFARLRTEAAQRKAERAREAERQRQLAALKAEMTERPGMDRKRLAELLRTAQAALDDFATTAAEHNAQVREWRTRMQALGVPEMVNLVPPAEHAQLGWRPIHDGVTLLVGYPTAQINQINPGALLSGMVTGVTLRHRLGPVTHAQLDPYAVLGEQA